VPPQGFLDEFPTRFLSRHKGVFPITKQTSTLWPSQFGSDSSSLTSHIGSLTLYLCICSSHGFSLSSEHSLTQCDLIPNSLIAPILSTTSLVRRLSPLPHSPMHLYLLRPENGLHLHFSSFCRKKTRGSITGGPIWVLYVPLDDSFHLSQLDLHASIHCGWLVFQLPTSSH
jgi:hypothetical protein